MDKTTVTDQTFQHGDSAPGAIPVWNVVLSNILLVLLIHRGIS